MPLLTPTTKLEAVNTLLRMSGEPPVNTIENTGLPQVDMAVSTIDQVTREVLSRGFNFNTDEKFKLTPDANGNILVPANAASVDASDKYRNIVQRGGRLYDKDNNTYVFTDPFLECDIKWMFDFEDLPECVRNYIIIRAGRLYQNSVIGSTTLYQLTQKDEEDALAVMMSEESDSSDCNFLDDGGSRAAFYYRTDL